MRPLGVAPHPVGIERGLHLRDRLEPSPAALAPEVLVAQGAEQPLDDAVGLWAPSPGALLLDPFALEERIVGGLVLAAAERAAVVAHHGIDGGAVLLEDRRDVVVEQLHGGTRQLVGMEARPDLATEAVVRSPWMELADPLEYADDEVIDRDQGDAGLPDGPTSPRAARGCQPLTPS